MAENSSGDGLQDATTDREIVMSRVVSASPEAIFEAFTQIEHLSQWWAPDGTSITTRSFEFEVGGNWDFLLHLPDGSDYPEWVTWREIVPAERVVLLYGTSRQDPNAFESTVVFEPAGDQTRIAMRSVFPTKEVRDEAVEKHYAIEGSEQMLRNLETFVSEHSQNGTNPN